MKKCPYCAEEIQDEAIVCRYCGRELTSSAVPQQLPTPIPPTQKTTTAPAKKPNSFIRLIGIGAAVVVTFCCVIGAGLMLSSNSNQTPTAAPRPTNPVATVVIKIPTSITEPTPTTAPTIAPTQELGKTRDNPLPRNSVVDIGDMEVMITNVQRPANDIIAQGNMFNATPIPNIQEYMIVKLHVECKKSTNEKCNFNDYEFKTVGRDGQIHDRASVVGVPQAFEPFAEFFGGAALDGNIAFLVTQGDPSIVLFHEPLFFGDPVYISLNQ